ncbi:DUF3530 family protein [Candidatus Thioglobus sp.]|uniref:DUF3530 family protein n=1 Tax=Candidatus Thioglobus sp. TaxID=2026721 RepID=UPI00262DD2F3|nr:DUF3530 family protein [Candidatus Thioglobus sp.]MDG2395117.1 DUF3530 family protein [Candidatus Thioglobus sp.]
MNVSAFLPSIDKLSSFPDFSQLPKFPELPKLEGFDTTSLQKLYNQFTEVKPDYAREVRMIGEIEEAVMDGDVEYLPLSNDKEVFSIYMEADVENPKGGVIVLHSRGYHANWESTIKPLRIGLADKGWHSLSVQMPVLDKQATYYDYVPIFPYAHERIDAAIEFYEQRGIDNVILIAHGCGAHMAMSYFDKYGDDKIKAYVGIGMGATDYKQKVIKRMPLDIMLKPVLDVYGEKDFSGVKRSAEERKWLMSLANNNQSDQKVIANADHYYKEGDTANDLVLTINQWLSALD